MRTSLIRKLFSLDRVTSWSRDVNKHGGWGQKHQPFYSGRSETKTNMAAGVNNFNPFITLAKTPKQIWPTCAPFKT